MSLSDREQRKRSEGTSGRGNGSAGEEEEMMRRWEDEPQRKEDGGRVCRGHAVSAGEP